jgi:hypothetical protein
MKKELFDFCGVYILPHDKYKNSNIRKTYLLSLLLLLPLGAWGIHGDEKTL